MELNDLLRNHGIDLKKTIVMRHRPDEPGLRKALPWWVHDRPEWFNAYQQSHSGAQEKALARLAGDGWLVSFLGQKPGEGVFCGLYRIAGAEEIDRRTFWNIPANTTLRDHGMLGWARKGRERGLWFDLRLDDSFHDDWIGKLIIGWPGIDRSWWRRAERNVMPVKAICEESKFAEAMPDWRELLLTWSELSSIPPAPLAGDLSDTGPE